MDPRERSRYMSDTYLGRSVVSGSESWLRLEAQQLKELRSRERIQALPTNTRDQVKLDALVQYRAAFHSGLAVSCLAVMIVDTTQRVASASHYQTFTALELDKLALDTRFTPAQRQRMIDHIDLPTTAIIVSQNSRKATIAEATEDAIRGYERVSSPTLGRNAGVLIAGIAYASPDEVLELEEYARGILHPTGLPLIASHLGRQDGAYASLNHAKLQGFGFYNTKTRQQQHLGNF